MAAWIGDWKGLRHQDAAESVDSYDAIFAIHLKEIDHQNGKCGSFKQIIKGIGGPSCHSDLYSCKELSLIQGKSNGLTANVRLDYCDAYMDNLLVSLKDNFKQY